MTRLHALIVYAHPEPTSFCAAMKDAAVAALQEADLTVEVSDLYAENFNPVAGRHDFLEAADRVRFHYQSEQLAAAARGTFAPDIVREQRRVDAADIIIFIFPLWWGGVPAILKGWFDRVLAYGFAYADGKRFDTGFFRTRLGLLAIGTGGTTERFSQGGTYGEIGTVLHGVQHCMLAYLGLTVLDPFVAYAAPRVDDAQRQAYLDAWQSRLREAVGDPAWRAALQRGDRDARAAATGTAGAWTAKV